MVHLYTFLISHFSEKVRFALDLGGIAYEERALLPGPHIMTVRRIARGTSVPLLVHEGGPGRDRTIVQGSSAILDYAEAQLGLAVSARGPDAREHAKKIEALADDAFGRGVQTIFYDALLRDRKAMIGLWGQGGGGGARAFYSVAFPLMANRIRAMYRVTPAGVASAKDRFRRALDETDRALEGQPYLEGDAPGRADVTIASLLAPACVPPEHVVRWPTELPSDLGAFVSEIENRPTLLHARRMYREHRARRSPS